MSVQLEAFLWGFGTAIGELPLILWLERRVRFESNILALSKQKADEFLEIEEDIQKSDLISKIKKLIYVSLKKHGFLTVLICASIPNPLFDLAGLTCGHFGIAFFTFFSATAIGKAIIKVHLQVKYNF